MLDELAHQPAPTPLNAGTLEAFIAKRDVLLAQLDTLVHSGPPLDQEERACLQKARERAQLLYTAAECRLETIRDQLHKVQGARSHTLDPEAGPTGHIINRIG